MYIDMYVHVMDVTRGEEAFAFAGVTTLGDR